MRIGFVGLGRMGANMVRRLLRDSHDRDVPAPVITLSLMNRFRSRQDDSYGAKVLAALRNEFGGHEVKTE